MSTKPAHTPTPWVFATNKSGASFITNENGKFTVANTVSTAEDAALIVHAVNSHAELVAALESLVNILSKDSQLLERYCEVSDASLGDAINLLERLAKAKGQP